MIKIARITQRIINDLKKQGFKGDVTVTFNPNEPTGFENFSGSWTIKIVPKDVRKRK